jgi:hypothetical protein
MRLVEGTYSRYAFSETVIRTGVIRIITCSKFRKNSRRLSLLPFNLTLRRVTNEIEILFRLVHDTAIDNLSSNVLQHYR